MSEEINFYSIITKILLVFNVISLFFTFVVVLIYAFAQYIGIEFLNLFGEWFGTSSFWYEKGVALFELILSIPGALDNLFMAIIILATANVFYLSYKTQKGGWLGFFFFISIGLPIWIYLASKVVDIRNSMLSYLNSTLSIKPDTVFFDFFTSYSLEISAFIFIMAIIIHMIDWENVREKVAGITQKGSSTEETITEKFEQ